MGRAVGVDLWRGVDQSGNSAEATRRNAIAEGVADRVELHTGDITALPFAENSFDVVVSSLAIHNISGGLSRRTLARRLNDPAFRRRLGKVRAELFERGMGILAAAQAGAASALVRLLKSENESVRLGASRSVFELGAKARETVEIEERLSALEDGPVNGGHR
jgi:hypothetical protein